MEDVKCFKCGKVPRLEVAAEMDIIKGEKQPILHHVFFTLGSSACRTYASIRIDLSIVPYVCLNNYVLVIPILDATQTGVSLHKEVKRTLKRWNNPKMHTVTVTCPSSTSMPYSSSFRCSGIILCRRFVVVVIRNVVVRFIVQASNTTVKNRGFNSHPAKLPP